MTDRKSKFGFKIKLSEETSEKLIQEAQNLKSNIVEVIEKKDLKIHEDLPEVNSKPVPAPSTIEKSKYTEPASSSTENVNSEHADIVKDNNKQSSAPPTADSYTEYSQYIHYVGDEAIYTDPSTNEQYVWSKELNEWTSRDNTQDKNVSIEVDKSGSQPAVSMDSDNAHGTYTDSDGTIMVWDYDKNAWFPKVDEDFLAQYQMSYGFTDAPAIATPVIIESETEVVETKDLKRKGPEEPKWFEIAEEQNTKVYVSNLPLDITEEEFVDIMQKCGLVMRDPKTQKMKIKLYTKPNSQQLKGDALCTYIKIESVDLALSILDGYSIRNHNLSVQKASFQMKGDYNPALKPKKKRRKDKEKEKKMQEKLFDWRPEKMRGERAKHEKVVIIKNLFEPSLFDNEVQLLLEYQQDMREECSKCGEVKRVVLYDRHPEGVAQITMKEPEEADSVVKLINGRWFGKRQLTADIWDGKTKYKMQETDADMKKRVDGFGDFLEDDKKAAKDSKSTDDDSKLIKGDSKPCENDNKLMEGDIQPMEDDSKLTEGDLQPMEDDFKPMEVGGEPIKDNTVATSTD